MMISDTSYWICFFIVLVLTGGISYLLSKKKEKKWIQSLGIVLIIVIIIVNKWIFPNVYTVQQCGQVKKEIMLVPKTITGGVSMSYGKHCYLVNNSSNPLKVETIIYGHASTSDSSKVIEDILPASAAKEYHVVAFDYIFETEPNTMSSKSSSEIKYKVSCN